VGPGTIHAPLPGGDDLVVAKNGDRDPGSLLQVLLPAPLPGGDDWLLPRVVTGTLAVFSRFFSLLFYLVVMIWLLPRVVTGTLAVSSRFLLLLALLPGGDDLVVAKSGDRDPGSLLQVLISAPLPVGDDLLVAKSGDRDPGSLLQVLLPAPGVELLGCNGTRHWAHRLTAHLMPGHVGNFETVNKISGHHAQ
jgi:hypothetical protein